MLGALTDTLVKYRLVILALLVLVATPLLFGGGETSAAHTPAHSAQAGVGTGDEAQVTNVGRTVADIISFVAGGIAVIFIIIGGFRYVTSSGDSSKVASARSAIIYAAVGIVVVLLARVIVSFVLSEADPPAVTVPPNVR